ncbi:MAG: hypothetical protein SYR96_32145 [Actinomycetota bacterium]|nr:hypothetical protein [Actinomycetota bacterium]
MNKVRRKIFTTMTALAVMAATSLAWTAPARSAPAQAARTSTVAVTPASADGTSLNAAGPVAVTLIATSPGVRFAAAGKQLSPLVPAEDSVSTQAAAPPTCWTAFAPPVPAGAALAHWYRNCNDFTTWQRGVVDYGGSRYNVTDCFPLGGGGWALWTYSSTVLGSYTTAHC